MEKFEPDWLKAAKERRKTDASLPGVSKEGQTLLALLRIEKLMLDVASYTLAGYIIEIVPEDEDEEQS